MDRDIRPETQQRDNDVLTLRKRRTSIGWCVWATAMVEILLGNAIDWILVLTTT